jgi:hypothetical protein
MKIQLRRVNRSHLFRMAWIIANLGASLYGDQPSMYFNLSLRLAWAKMQSMDTISLMKVLTTPYRPRGKKLVPVLRNQLRIQFKDYQSQSAS